MEKGKLFNKKLLSVIIVIIVVLIVVVYVFCVWWCPARRVTTVFLVRHAEYDMSTGHLNAAGEQRANELATVLSKVNVDVIYATGAIRTQETAQPLANSKGLGILIYSDVNSLVNQVKQDHSGDVVLIVGHADTVVETIDELVEESTGYVMGNEFYRIFIVSIYRSGGWWVTNLKYGEVP